MAIIVVSTPGSYIGSTKERFKISYGGTDQPVSYIPANKVDGFIIENKATITSGAFTLFRKYGISVIWTSYKDDGLVLMPFNHHGSVQVRKNQYAAIEDARALLLATKFVHASCKNKLMLLLRIEENKEEFKDTYSDELDSISQVISEFENEDEEYETLDLELRQELMSYEARVAKYYYSALRIVLEEYGWTFENRSRRPARDEFNAMLNYGYAVLRGQMVERIAITGLDIYAGFLHTDRSGRESLVLDLIEEFRQVAVDEILLKLVFSEQLNLEMFSHEDGGIILGDNVKKLYLEHLFSAYSTKIRDLTLKNWFLNQARQVSSFLQQHILDYVPYYIKMKDPW